MAIVNKEGIVKDDPWTVVADDASVPSGTSVIVPFERLKNDHNAILATAGAVGVEVLGDVDLEELVPFLPQLSLVMVRFTTMRDGRPFSVGRLLRERHGFGGDLRAVGPFIPDQILFLLRCGYSTFSVGDDFKIDTMKRSIAAYSAWYQRAADRVSTAADLRRKSDSSDDEEGGPASKRPNLLKSLTERYDDATALDIVQDSLREFEGRIALVSSFGTESAILLHMISRIDPRTPVVFLDTGKLFGETKRYRDQLVRLFGLSDVRSVTPDADKIKAHDPQGVLWSKNADLCCALRKVEPLRRALMPFDAWFTGRKAFQAASRATLPVVEIAEGRFKINPLAAWHREDIQAYFAAHDLPRHPLEPDGYLSIGCMPCTTRVAEGEDVRAGRWRGTSKDECGIHLPQGQVAVAALS